MGVIRLNAAHLNPLFRVSHVVDSFAPDKGKALAANYDAKFESSLDDALADPTLDAVWLATPTPEHKECIKKCLKKKIPVGVEKPVCGDPTDIAECFDLAQSQNTPLFCSFQRRFDSAYVGVAEKVQQGALGEAHTGLVVFRDHPVPPKEFMIGGGDVFVDLAVHDIDYIRYCYSAFQEPNYVWGKAFVFDKVLREHSVKEACKFTMCFPDDFSVTMDIGRVSSYGYDNSCEFSGSDACLRVDNPVMHSQVVRSSAGIQTTPYMHSFPERFEHAFRSEVNHFGEIIANGAKCKVSRTDCIRSLQIALACSESASKGAGVFLEFDGDKCRSELEVPTTN